ncbi:hypothetical protein VP01_1237g5 [Puccinia sorghi]|uniref:Uncharacterized protein n=1 Tax=Puccinia sorghi TaxID=27349 RepID=A0A0L6VPN2_9BASI|nr:hypothetical protein VP01_1237g5 [Puccinia sorghi]
MQDYIPSCFRNCQRHTVPSQDGIEYDVVGKSLVTDGTQDLLCEFEGDPNLIEHCFGGNYHPKKGGNVCKFP